MAKASRGGPSQIAGGSSGVAASADALDGVSETLNSHDVLLGDLNSKISLILKSIRRLKNNGDLTGRSRKEQDAAD